MNRWALMLIGITMASAPALVSAQISLAMVVDLAQRNSSTVKLAEADVQKANAALMQTEDVFVPSLTFAQGFRHFTRLASCGGAVNI